MISRIKLLTGGLAVLALFLAFWFGYRHYTNLLKDKGLAEQTVVSLKNALDIERATVRDLQSATGDWKEAQGRLLRSIHQMQENSNAAELETKRLHTLFSEVHWDSASVDTLPGSVTDRLFSKLSAATERGFDGGGATDSATTAKSEAGGTHER